MVNVIHPPRNIPLALQPKLDKELDEMVEQGIIIPVIDYLSLGQCTCNS